MHAAARSLLLLGGAISTAIALLHGIIIFVGAPAYRYFGAGEEMARMAEGGSIFPAALTAFIALVFGVFAAYAFSGAKVIRRLPLLRTGLLTIGSIYLLRGLLVVAQVAQLARSGHSLVHRAVVFSLVSLVTGIVYLAGTIAAWRSLRPL